MAISSVNSGNTGIVSSANSGQSQTLKTLLASLENQPTLLDVLAADSTNAATSSGDILDLSTQGQSAADQLYQVLESAAASSVQTSADEAAASLQQKLDAALSQNGIDTSQEIDLQVDANGNVVVSNDNPQKQQIEDAINNNPELKKAVTQYLQFMQAIAPTLENGNSSQADFGTELGQVLSSLGSGAQGAVTLTIQGNAFQTVYQDANDNSVVLASSQVQ